MSTLSAICWLARRRLRSPGNAAYISSGAAKKELVALHPHPVGVGAEFAGVDAQQDVLGFGVLAVDVVGVAGGDQRQAHSLRELDGPFHAQPLDLEAVVLDLDEVPIAEHAVEPGGDFHRPASRSARLRCRCRIARLNSPETQPLRQMMPFAVGREQLLVDPRLEVKALARRPARPA